eukprot:TRINITY_DN12085_c4_g1_i2.p3 TRINITY_DN12085_c4_g1~~TRINITY_DN12085_c4_g1_i2.p3  ORF type:complete len:216 (+),score=57.83 TRINITY_DN12085_c4_g1_i2:6535-7182(+)
MAQARSLQDVQQEANEVLDADVEATRRMRDLVVADQQMNQETLAQLDEQGEQLRRIEKGLDGINANTSKAEKELTQMEKCCGLCLCPCTPRHNFEGREDYNKTWKNGEQQAEGEDGVIDSQPGAASARGTSSAGGKGQGGRYVESIVGDAREDEMNENMGVVHNVLGDLKAQAMAMGEELDDQNEMIDRINDKTASNVDRVQAASDRTAVLIKRA